MSVPITISNLPTMMSPNDVDELNPDYAAAALEYHAHLNFPVKHYRNALGKIVLLDGVLIYFCACTRAVYRVAEDYVGPCSECQRKAEREKNAERDAPTTSIAPVSKTKSHICSQKCFERATLCPDSMQTIMVFGLPLRVFLDADRVPNLALDDLLAIVGSIRDVPQGVRLARHRMVLIPGKNAVLSVLPIQEALLSIYDLATFTDATIVIDNLIRTLYLPGSLAARVAQIRGLTHDCKPVKWFFDGDSKYGVRVCLRTGQVNLRDLVRVVYYFGRPLTAAEPLVTDEEMRFELINKVAPESVVNAYRNDEFSIQDAVRVLADLPNVHVDAPGPVVNTRKDHRYDAVSIRDALRVIAYLPNVHFDFRERVANELCKHWQSDPRGDLPEEWTAQDPHGYMICPRLREIVSTCSPDVVPERVADDVPPIPDVSTSDIEQKLSNLEKMLAKLVQHMTLPM